MAKSAFIKLVEGSTQQDITLGDVKEKLEHYITMTNHTGKQLNWEYADAAFPYTMEVRSQENLQWLFLKGKDERHYKYLMIGIGTSRDETQVPCIQLVVPDGATHGDTAKANEFSRYLAKTFQGELHLLNGRVMYFNPRKP
ncbi:DUF1885 family protein [Kroppenstedtia pulmonis]|uniref:DUF1885 family protein n=1 Tax=Kroppenstedtia pulmonis TaxID=1380685 RepID=A0A7D3XJG4_9BACL|nr:DUF1885 family protein [Kroppenstedtia pulmonis]QKG84819.1 DUF1885 family protein [Kroppenstedtia pulmonis]